MVMITRAEGAADLEAVRHVNQRAFEGPVEAAIVDSLRDADAVAVSLVADLDGEVVGHIVFSPVTVGDQVLKYPLAGLAPMAVVPSRQHAGIGSELVREGLGRCRAAGYGAVVVLGHPGFYPRFGFSPAAEIGLHCIWPARPEAFMALELIPGALRGVRGEVTYHAAFGAPDE